LAGVKLLAIKFQGCFSGNGYNMYQGQGYAGMVVVKIFNFVGVVDLFSSCSVMEFTPFGS
jgi:hypothetical protein